MHSVDALRISTLNDAAMVSSIVLRLDALSCFFFNLFLFAIPPLLCNLFATGFVEFMLVLSARIRFLLFPLRANDFFRCTSAFVGKDLDRFFARMY